MATGPATVLKDWMGLLSLSGAEARTWLQGMVTNDVEKLRAGEGCYAGHLTAQGKLVAQATILSIDEGFLMLVDHVATTKLATVFDRLIVMEDVQVQDLSEAQVVLGLFGEQTASALEKWAAQPLGLDRLYNHRILNGYRVVRTEIGYDIIVPAEESQRVVGDLTQAGFTSADRASWDVARVEAGIPVYGLDVDESTVLPELGGPGISYDKGCYIGQEVVARIKYLGHVNRRFVGLICDGPDLPALRSPIQRNGKEVGYTTSAVFSPRLNRPIALGFVSRLAAEPGTDVLLLSEGKSLAARVAALPFVGAAPNAQT